MAKRSIMKIRHRSDFEQLIEAKKAARPVKPSITKKLEAPVKPERLSLGRLAEMVPCRRYDVKKAVTNEILSPETVRSVKTYIVPVLDDAGRPVLSGEPNQDGKFLPLSQKIERVTIRYSFTYSDIDLLRKLGLKSAKMKIVRPSQKTVFDARINEFVTKPVELK